MLLRMLYQLPNKQSSIHMNKIQDVFFNKSIVKSNKIQDIFQDSLICLSINICKCQLLLYKSNCYSISITIQISFLNQSLDFDHSFPLETILSLGFCFFISSSV